MTQCVRAGQLSRTVAKGAQFGAWETRADPGLHQLPLCERRQVLEPHRTGLLVCEMKDVSVPALNEITGAVSVPVLHEITHAVSVPALNEITRAVSVRISTPST